MKNLLLFEEASDQRPTDVRRYDDASMPVVSPPCTQHACQPPDTCYDCGSPLGAFHDALCNYVTKRVRVRCGPVEIILTVPHHFDRERIEFLNDRDFYELIEVIDPTPSTQDFCSTK